MISIKSKSAQGATGTRIKIRGNVLDVVAEAKKEQEAELV